MSYANFAEHTETYNINGTYVEVIANFVVDKVMIKTSKLANGVKWVGRSAVVGNMEQFAASKIGE